MALPASLKKRRDFLAAARARKHAATGVLLQARRRAGPGEGASAGAPAVQPADPLSDRAVRVGYTCSKKIGNAVARNRAKRRLRAAAARILPEGGQPGWDYVLIGRPGSTIDRPFEALVDDLREALTRVHTPRKPRRPRDVRTG
ncbi:MAG: ribonuclease P protein component [Pseudomonadota bacterium]